MPAHKLFGLAKEAHSFLSFCEEGLLLIGKHIAARTSLEKGVLDLRGMEAQSLHARNSPRNRGANTGLCRGGERSRN